MPEEIDALARRIEEKCGEIKQRFSEVFEMLPETIRRDMAEFLNVTIVRSRIGISITYANSTPDHAKECAVKVAKEDGGFVIIPKHIYYHYGVNYTKEGFIILDRSGSYSIGYSEFRSEFRDSIKTMLCRQLASPESAVAEIIQLLDQWYVLFFEYVNQYVNDNLSVREMFDRLISLRRSHKEVVAERDGVKEERDGLRRRLEYMRRVVRETARALGATKGLFKSKAIKRIRTRLEDVERPRPTTPLPSSNPSRLPEPPPTEPDDIDVVYGIEDGGDPPTRR